MLLQLNPPIPIKVCHQGKWTGALAHFLIDYGIEHNLIWHCCLDESGEWWAFENPSVRGTKNITCGRLAPWPSARS